MNDARIRHLLPKLTVLKDSTLNTIVDYSVPANIGRLRRERTNAEMALAHMRAQMEQLVEADMEALQVPAAARRLAAWSLMSSP